MNKGEERETIRIAGVVRESIVDGPGLRFVIFGQGCPHHCQECHNEETWDFEGGYDCEIKKILDAIDENPLLDGVTFSGGEPFSQPGQFAAIGREVKKKNLNITTFTGFVYEKLLADSQNNPEISELLEVTDILIDGPYLKSERDLTLKFRGSRNQRVIDLNNTQKSGEIVLWD